MKKNKRRLSAGVLLFYFVMLLPVWMWLAWLVWPKTKLVIAIVDKTVLNVAGQEHASLTWVLRNQKYSKTNDDLYGVKKDYFGFFPKENKEYELKGLEKFSTDQLDQIGTLSDMMYVTDTYGIYSTEWFLGRNITDRQRLIYGGLSANDMHLIKKMKQQKKLIITEFNTFATPTSPAIAAEMEKTFKIKWTGWVGKYFDSFDTLQNKELPVWLLRDYKKQNNNKWPFKKAGIAFVNKNEKIVILEYVKDLNSEVPHIITSKYNREKYNIPKSMKYPFWFDVIQTSRSNQILSFYNLEVTSRGRKILEENGIPPQFPAIIEHDRADYKFYYFCGDFADNPITQAGSYFKGIRFFRKMFYNDDIAAERSSFFWEFYAPIVTRILNDYEEGLKAKKK
ncbi:hypothetical protein [Daejeonella oryzae]|uniref:hypothetical protein n=1 Tax=Daejeonella oryzae TaxID=1122943 RepID=UPI0003FF7BFE|nr:hypothetical protein [Daejeonella oryzae]